jgi:heterodisulfide reductase subunit D
MTEAKKTAITEIPESAFTGELAHIRETLLTCIQCGSCSSSCPAVNNMDITPRTLWQLIRWGLRDEALNSRTFWICTQCYACTVRCPRGIITSENMRLLRKWAAEEGVGFPAICTTMIDTVTLQHNISGEDNARRLGWSENMDPVPLSLQPHPGAETVLFTGCVSAFYPMAYSIPQAMVQILEKVGASYTTMGGEEWCCGYPIYSVGIMEEQVAKAAAHNISKFKELGAKRLVTTCPSCYHTWTHIFPEVLPGAERIEVVHATEYLAELIREGKLKFAEQKPTTVTYHDPCDLGRKNGIFDAPRYIIQSIPGIKLVEMANNRENSLCCGGGGDVEMVDVQAIQDIAAQRMAQVRATGAQTLVSACQQCKRTLFRSARETKTRLRILDVTELVLNSLA